MFSSNLTGLQEAKIEKNIDNLNNINIFKCLGFLHTKLLWQANVSSLSQWNPKDFSSGEDKKGFLGWGTPGSVEEALLLGNRRIK